MLLYANKSSEPLLALCEIRIGQAIPVEWQTWQADGLMYQVKGKVGQPPCYPSSVTQAKREK
jgi:hypothetical protein